jgi:predicted DNA-binding protein
MKSTLLTPKAALKPRRVRVYPRLSLEVRNRLSEYGARKGLTERDLIEEAIRQYLDGTSEGAKVLAQLERLALAIDAERERRERAHREVHRAVEVLSEAFGRFVRLWILVHAATFKLPATEEAAESLYGKFAAKVAEYFRRGHRLLHDLPNVDDKIPAAAVRKP